MSVWRCVALRLVREHDGRITEELPPIWQLRIVVRGDVSKANITGDPCWLAW
jgi:hypothetical protein